MRPTISVRALRKAYGDVEAVRGVDLAIDPGEVVCLLGPNGAGKTTTTEILEGHRRPTSGTASVLGRDPARGERALRDRIGVVPQDSPLPPELMVGELLDMAARWYSRPRRPAELLDLVGLDVKRDTRVERLSGGQRRRLDLALPRAAVSIERDRILVTTGDGVGAVHRLTGWALERGLALERFAVAQPSLEDVYLSLMEATP